MKQSLQLHYCCAFKFRSTFLGLIAASLLISTFNLSAATPFQIAQQAYLTAHNGSGGDEFGYTVAVSGNTVVVGAWGQNSASTGVNAPDIGTALDSGAAYIFVRDGTNWTQQAYLKASNTDAGDSFGGRVAISGDAVVVGASRGQQRHRGQWRPD